MFRVTVGEVGSNGFHAFEDHVVILRGHFLNIGQADQIGQCLFEMHIVLELNTQMLLQRLPGGNAFLFVKFVHTRGAGKIRAARGADKKG